MFDVKITAHDKNIICTLATRVAEIASLPVQNENRKMWIRINRLERVRPLIHIQAIAPDIWEELIPNKQLQCIDSFCREQEMELRKKIYCWENFRDDRVVDDIVVCPIISNYNTGCGIEIGILKPKDNIGAHAFLPVIVEERDIEKIQTKSEIYVDWKETNTLFELLYNLYGDILKVEKRGFDFFNFAPMDMFIRWRGIEQMFMDLLDRPKWVHEGLERITTRYLGELEQLEKMNVLSLSNGNTRLGSGGYGWTDQLPQKDFDGAHVRIKDMWARAATQIFTEIISPEMHYEFAIQYEKRLLERFGLSCYGCCEPLHKKMSVVRKIRNLRRVSMSPWVDIEVASREVGRDLVYTHKPNPAIVSMEQWHPDLAREKLKDAFEKTRNNILEVNLQDIHTVRNEPNRLTEWRNIAFELAEEYI
ncbi:MAG: hypothetical protein AABY84_02785 [Candidatus Firestonebacteria bacterium]